ncbi:MAG: hypothetical protein MI864_01385 [Pseudomonadales bacterium]|nr:hypothetical protein [Pseudomonadales bacterium]
MIRKENDVQMDENTSQSKHEWFTPTVKEFDARTLTQAAGMNTSDTPSNNKSGS